MTSAASDAWNLSWTYDVAGNRLTEARDGVLADYDLASGTNRLTRVTDAAGVRRGVCNDLLADLGDERMQVPPHRATGQAVRSGLLQRAGARTAGREAEPPGLEVPMHLVEQRRQAPALVDHHEAVRRQRPWLEREPPRIGRPRLLRALVQTAS